MVLYDPNTECHSKVCNSTICLSLIKYLDSDSEVKGL